jgi:hypothetical protein
MPPPFALNCPPPPSGNFWQSAAGRSIDRRRLALSVHLAGQFFWYSAENFYIGLLLP